MVPLGVVHWTITVLLVADTRVTVIPPGGVAATAVVNVPKLVLVPALFVVDKLKSYAVFGSKPVMLTPVVDCCARDVNVLAVCALYCNT